MPNVRSSRRVAELACALSILTALIGCNVKVGSVNANGQINANGTLNQGGAGNSGSKTMSGAGSGGAGGASTDPGAAAPDAGFGPPPPIDNGGSSGGNPGPTSPPPTNVPPPNQPPPINPMMGCGDVGMMCCFQSGPSGSCNSSAAVCNSSNHMCQACGGIGDLCCAGSACDAGGLCGGNGKCQACGGLSQPCCTSGAACSGSYACTGASICDVPCTLPEVPNGGSCAVPAPRQVAPLSGSNLTRRLPKLSWELPASVTDAHVQLCQDRDCTSVIEENDVSGSSYTVMSALPMGNVYWRVRSIHAGSTTLLQSPAWQLEVGGAHDAPISNAWGCSPDFDGDGHADVVMMTASDTRVYAGSASGLAGSPTVIGSGSTFPSGSSFVVGDVNGDGYVDLVSGNQPGNTYVFDGGSGGLPASPSQTLNTNGVGGIGTNAAIGDVNGDGYGDFVYLTSQDDGSGNQFVVIDVLAGGSGGLAINPTTTLTDVVSNNFPALEVADIDADGYADVIVTKGGAGSSNGTLMLFAGGSSGVSATHKDVTVSSMAPAFAAFCAGDVNGDGYLDLAVTSNQSLLVYHGGSAGIAATSSATLSFSVPTFGPKATATLGLGDVNGDGYSDLVAVVNNQGQARIFYGSSTGVSSGSSTLLSPPNPPSFTPSSSTVQAVSAISDVNGDGYADVAFSVDWQNSSMVHNHQFYAWNGGTSVSSTPATTLAQNVSAIR